MVASEAKRGDEGREVDRPRLREEGREVKRQKLRIEERREHLVFFKVQLKC